MTRERQTVRQGRSRGPETCRLASTRNANVLAVEIDSSLANGRDRPGAARDFPNFIQTLGLGMSWLRQRAPARPRDAAGGSSWRRGALGARAPTAVQASAASPSEGSTLSRIRSAISPELSRIAASMRLAISGLAFRNVLAFSRP